MFAIVVVVVVHDVAVQVTLVIILAGIMVGLGTYNYDGVVVVSISPLHMSHNTNNSPSTDLQTPLTRNITLINSTTNETYTVLESYTNRTIRNMSPWYAGMCICMYLCVSGGC